MLRIIGGRHRGRRLETEPGSRVRPTADRVREAVFNKLMHGLIGEGGAALADVRVVDVFAGTGAMGLEALSRGAAFATFMDLDIVPCRANVAALGEAVRAILIAGDCTRPGPASEVHDIVFLDPPYGLELAAPALAALAGAGWLGDGAVCVVELGTEEAIGPPGGFSLVDSRAYGAARVEILRYEIR